MRYRTLRMLKSIGEMANFKHCAMPGNQRRVALIKTTLFTSELMRSGLPETTKQAADKPLRKHQVL